MGDTVEQLLEGEICQVCGEYLGDGDGYPVTCAGCIEEANKDKETG